MTREILLREFMAVAHLGCGFNYVVEAVFPLTEEHRARSILKSVLGRVDHRYLGLDQDLGFTPDSSALCEFLFQSLKAVGVRSLKLSRGDGYIFICYGQL